MINEMELYKCDKVHWKNLELGGFEGDMYPKHIEQNLTSYLRVKEHMLFL